MFDDRPAAGFMTCAKYWSFHPLLVEQESLKLVWDSYVDDIHTRGSQKDIDRIMGTLDSFSKPTVTFPRLLDNVGLKLKSWCKVIQKILKVIKDYQVLH